MYEHTQKGIASDHPCKPASTASLPRDGQVLLHRLRSGFVRRARTATKSPTTTNGANRPPLFFSIRPTVNQRPATCRPMPTYRKTQMSLPLPGYILQEWDCCLAYSPLRERQLRTLCRPTRPGSGPYQPHRTQGRVVLVSLLAFAKETGRQYRGCNSFCFLFPLPLLSKRGFLLQYTFYNNAHSLKKTAPCSTAGAPNNRTEFHLSGVNIRSQRLVINCRSREQKKKVI